METATAAAIAIVVVLAVLGILIYFVITANDALNSDGYSGRRPRPILDDEDEQ